MAKHEDPNLFRSEPMSYVSLYMEADAAHDMVRELGKLSLIEFRDLNPGVTAFQRAHVADIKRCEELERRMRQLREVVQRGKVPFNPNTVTSSSLPDIEAKLDSWSSVFEASRHYEVLQRTLEKRTEERVVLQKCADIFYQSPDLSQSPTPTRREGALLESNVRSDTNVGRLGQVCGSLPVTMMATFERIVFRATRGNSVTKFSPMDHRTKDPVTGELVEKIAFMTFFSGSVLERKLTTIAERLGASIFEFPTKSSDRLHHQKELSSDVFEIEAVLSRTQSDLKVLLANVADRIVSFEHKVAQEKAVFHIMNMFEAKQGQKSVRAEGWCTCRGLSEVRGAVQRVATENNYPCPILNETRAPVSASHGHGHNEDGPPTYFRTNKLTSGFQAIVDAYGIANYQEFNPMPFTVITFPFLFAVMFGDFGHGFLMFLFAVGMIIKERYFLEHPPGEIFGICFGGRYVILLMSLFSMYTGLLYNDTFAMSFDWWGSASYNAICDESGAHGCHRYHFENYDLINGPQCEDGPCVEILKTDAQFYPFGLDPVWKRAENELSFTNSVKMKLSIVLGVVQMGFGVLLSGLNHIHFKNHISLIHEFIPQIIFLSSVFGYMVLLIFVKWGTYYENTHCAPSILTTFIDMYLGFGTVNSEPGCEEYAELIPNQSMIERILILLAFVSVPWMLLAKPLLLKAKFAAQHSQYQQHIDEEADVEFSEAKKAHVEVFDFPEEMVHQIIHTIEYVLGTVSNTASYLRLWALSLAHAQLSTVFWEKVMIDNIHSGNPVAIVICFMIWVFCTFAVLMVMESLSAFLHALRLHWVEFQNKFYGGAGVSFKPFSFTASKLE